MIEGSIMIAAKNALIAWNGADDGCDRVASHPTPPGAVAVGPLLDDISRSDWSRPYSCTGGAAWVARRKLFGIAQQLQVMEDYYQLVYVYGLDPCVVHRAFLEIADFQAIIKRMGCGPAKDEPGHDPDVGYGRAITTRSPMKVFRAHGALHVWPTLQGP
jgi:hypothetical protein